MLCKEVIISVKIPNEVIGDPLSESFALDTDAYVTAIANGIKSLMLNDEQVLVEGVYDGTI